MSPEDIIKPLFIFVAAVFLVLAIQLYMAGKYLEALSFFELAEVAVALLVIVLLLLYIREMKLGGST